MNAGGPGDADTAAGGAGMAGDEGTAGNRAETAGGADTGRLFLVGDPQQSIYVFAALTLMPISLPGSGTPVVQPPR